MVYDIIYLIPQQVRLSICQQCLFLNIYISSSLLGSIPSRARSHFKHEISLSLTYERSGENGQNCMSSISLFCQVTA